MTYLQDIEFLKTICAQHNQQVTARIALLDFNELNKEEITGIIQSGTINLDGTSALQRTCSLSMILSKQNSLENWVLESKIKIEIGLQNITNLYPEDSMCWFPMGVYYLTGFSINETSTGYAISLQAKDKMSKLNGEIGGSLNSIVDFGQIDIINEKNNIITQKIPISTIIKNLVHIYGQEPLNKIFIYGLEDYGLKLMTYYGDQPLYVILDKTNNYSIINYTFDGNYKVYEVKENTQASEPIRLKKIPEKNKDNINNFFISEYNILKKKNEYNSFYLADGQEIYIKKCNYGDTIGYVLTDLVYAEDLIGNVGETLKSILDKIINMLEVFEYYYDTDGNFIFKKQDKYVEVNSYLNPSVVFNKPIFSFENNKLIVNNNQSYDLQNIKNDYTIWGQKKNSKDADPIDIHMRIAFDKKPISYSTIKINPERAAYLIKEYSDFFPKLSNETEEEQLKRLQTSSITYEYSYDNKDIQDSGVGETRYVDWREIIYQMAQDYKKYNYVKEFHKWVEEKNSQYKNGITGYERYYTDLDGFWRTLYQKYPEPVQLNEQLSGNQFYSIGKDKPEGPKTGSGLIVDKGNQILNNKFTWTVPNDNYLAYKVLYYFYIYWRSFYTNEITKIKINTTDESMITDDGAVNKNVGRSFSQSEIARILTKLEEENSVETIKTNDLFLPSSTSSFNLLIEQNLFEFIQTNDTEINKLKKYYEAVYKNNKIIYYRIVANPKKEQLNNYYEGKIGLKSNYIIIDNVKFENDDNNLLLDPLKIYDEIKTETETKITMNENHLIIWALINNLLYDENNQLITTFEDLTYGTSYIIAPMFYSRKSDNADKKTDLEQQMRNISNLFKGINKKGLFIPKPNTFLKLQDYSSFKTNLLYDTQTTENFALFNLIKDEDTKEEQYVYIGECQDIINNNYQILSKMYKYMAQQAGTKSYIIREDQQTGQRDTIIGDSTLARLLSYNFKDVSSERFQEIHNQAWYFYDYETNSYDSPFGDPKAIYYDIVHLYRLKNTNKEDNLSSEEIYSKVQDYPVNKDGVSLTNLLDMSKDTNQLLLWAQAYQILNKISKDIDQTIHFNKNIVIDPSKLIFWFDFWDTKTFSSQYSISKIGPRELNKTNQNASAVEYIPYLNNIFLNYAENVSSDENKIQKFYQSNYFQNNKNLQIFRLGKNDQQLLALSEQGLSLASIMNNEIYNHSYMTQNVNITGIPQYFLQPNYLISIVDTELQREDKYVINKISYQLKAGGTMSIQAVKMLPDIIEKQDTRKEIING